MRERSFEDEIAATVAASARADAKRAYARAFNEYLAAVRAGNGIAAGRARETMRDQLSLMGIPTNRQRRRLDWRRP